MKVMDAAAQTATYGWTTVLCIVVSRLSLVFLPPPCCFVAFSSPCRLVHVREKSTGAANPVEFSLPLGCVSRPTATAQGRRRHRHQPHLLLAGHTLCCLFPLTPPPPSRHVCRRFDQPQCGHPHHHLRQQGPSNRRSQALRQTAATHCAALTAPRTCACAPCATTRRQCTTNHDNGDARHLRMHSCDSSCRWCRRCRQSSLPHWGRRVWCAVARRTVR